MSIHKRLTRRGDQGSAAVEFALVLPVLLLLLFGIIDFGRMLSAKITLTEAAREGARAAALVDADAGRERAIESAGNLAVAPQIDEPCPESPDPSESGSVTLTLTHQFEFITPITILAGLGGGDGAVTMTATGSMPCL